MVFSIFLFFFFFDNRIHAFGAPVYLIEFFHRRSGVCWKSSCPAFNRSAPSRMQYRDTYRPYKYRICPCAVRGLLFQWNSRQKFRGGSRLASDSIWTIFFRRNPPSRTCVHAVPSRAPPLHLGVAFRGCHVATRQGSNRCNRSCLSASRCAAAISGTLENHFFTRVQHCASRASSLGSTRRRTTVKFPAH